jgi:hypothetical protein
MDYGTMVQKAVNIALDNALINGYNMLLLPAEDIADDMISYESDFENWESDILIPYIEVWLLSKQPNI